jgi:thiamine-monophosphate kinase
MGRCERPLRRDAARPGEEVWLIGALGMAAAGLSCLRLGWGEDASSPQTRRLGHGAARRVAIERCVTAWRRPRALLAHGRELCPLASACIDVSDGLAADAARLAQASGVRLVIERERLRAALDPGLLEVSRALGRSALHFALQGGEDYALLATGPRARRPDFARQIGYVARGFGARLTSPTGARLLSGGFDHFTS